jgi:hypothetical protein
MAEKFTTPSERIVRRHHLAAAFNAEKMLREGKFIVDLACGHKTYTRNLNKAVCPRCTEMLRRSIKDGSEDLESFRYRNGHDTMEWPADPCRQFHETLTEES